MTDKKFGLSRRKLLGSMGVIGASAALGGAGTMAFFSDEENFENNKLVAGSLDMKAAYSAHYSDWSSEEGDGVNIRMWNGAPGTTGTASDLDSGETGMPTNDAWLIAVDDPEKFLANTLTGSDGDASSCGETGTDADGLEKPVIDLDDVKPGDFGEVTFDFRLCDNPGYVWLTGALKDASENGITEPEGEDEDEKEGVVELLDVVQAAYWIDDGDNYQDGDETPAFVGSLREVLDALSTDSGALLEGDIPAEEGGGTGGHCFSPGTKHSVAFAWWVPVDHGNEIQTDSATFDLGFYTEQCRHNSVDGNGITTSTGDGFAKVSESFNGDNTISGGARARYGDNGGTAQGELYVGDEPGVAGEYQQAQYTWTTDPKPWSVGPRDWTVAYDASTDELTFTFDGNTVTSTLDNPQPDGRMAVQCKANEATVSATVDSLSIGGSSQTFGPTTSVSVTDDDGTSSNQIAYLLFDTALDGATDFEISGTASVDVQSDFLDYGGASESFTFDVVFE